MHFWLVIEFFFFFGYSLNFSIKIIYQRNRTIYAQKSERKKIEKKMQGMRYENLTSNIQCFVKNEV